MDEEAIKAVLEAFFVGLFSGQKKFVIDSIPQEFDGGAEGIRHTVKVIDSNG